MVCVLQFCSWALRPQHLTEKEDFFKGLVGKLCKLQLYLYMF